jgi:hypothetical protein
MKYLKFIEKCLKYSINNNSTLSTIYIQKTQKIEILFSKK